MLRGLRLFLVTLLGSAVTGCVVHAPPGEPVYGPPAVVVEPPTYEFSWWVWPHYEVDHHYVIDGDHVRIHDQHYYPGYDETHRYVHNDGGRHRGWFEHQD